MYLFLQNFSRPPWSTLAVPVVVLLQAPLVGLSRYLVFTINILTMFARGASYRSTGRRAVVVVER
jgi:hypothetical protein